MSMMVLVTYDVNVETAAGRRRLRHVAKACTRYGQRVQNSVFECVISMSDYLLLKDELLGIIDKSHDSLRIYHLGSNYASHIESFGVDQHIDVGEVMML